MVFYTYLVPDGCGKISQECVGRFSEAYLQWCSLTPGIVYPPKFSWMVVPAWAMVLTLAV